MVPGVSTHRDLGNCGLSVSLTGPQAASPLQMLVPLMFIKRCYEKAAMPTYNLPTMIWLLLAGFMVTLTAGTLRIDAQAPPNGTTVYRCIDQNGIISFADAPCSKSVSHRLRIEHSLIQSVPISIEEQQRLYALEARLNGERSQKKSRRLAASKKRLAQDQVAALRCKQARLGLAQIRSRKKRGYPIGQSERIDSEHEALQGEIRTFCDNSP